MSPIRATRLLSRVKAQGTRSVSASARRRSCSPPTGVGFHDRAERAGAIALHPRPGARSGIQGVDAKSVATRAVVDLLTEVATVIRRPSGGWAQGMVAIQTNCGSSARA